MTVDVILPIYKPDNNVFKAIDSVINQTYDNWILHIVDDASGDNSLEKIRDKYDNLNGKIKYYQLEKNRRQAFARNYAISKSHGEYIAFIDQDDVWVNEKLEWQVNLITKGNYDAVHGNLMMINNNDEVVFREKWEKENEGRRRVEWQLSNKELAMKIFFEPNIRIISSMVTRKIFEKIVGFKYQFFGGEDELFWFEIVLHGKIGYLDKILFKRREHFNNALNVYRTERLIGYYKAIQYMKVKYSPVISKLIPIREREILYSVTSNLFKSKNIFFVKYLIKLLSKYPSYLFFKLYKSLNNIKVFYKGKIN